MQEAQICLFFICVFDSLFAYIFIYLFVCLLIYLFSKSSYVCLDYCMPIGVATRTIQNENTPSNVFLLYFNIYPYLVTYHPVLYTFYLCLCPDLTSWVCDLQSCTAHTLQDHTHGLMLHCRSLEFLNF